MVRVADNRALGAALLISGTVLYMCLAGCGHQTSDSGNREPATQSDRYDRAISKLNRAIEQNPQDARAYYERGLIYYNKGEFGRAEQDVQKAQSLGYQVPPEFLKMLYEGLSENR